jgi:hypothetical protein
VPATVLSKFGDESSIIAYWWHDPDAAADLKAAMAGGYALPAKKEEINFDTLFK